MDECPRDANYHSEEDEACVPQMPQFSQGTVACSTPASGHDRRRPFRFSSDVSEISNDNLPEVRPLNSRGQMNLDGIMESSSTPTSDVGHSPSVVSSDGSDSQAIYSISCDDENFPPKKKFKRNIKVQEWDLFKPNRPNTIYEFIALNPQCGLDGAKRWLNDYINNRSEAITVFLQFVVDVCGFVNVDLSARFKYEEENFREIIDYMEQHPPKILGDNLYIMSSNSEWCKQTRHGIYEFIRNVFQLAHENRVLYDCEMIRFLIGFPMSLTSTTNRAMYHTGLSIIIKTYTCLLNIFEELQDDSALSDSSHLDIVSQILDKLQAPIEKGCLLNDTNLSGLRVLFCEEAWKWFKIEPSHIERTKFFGRILRFLSDRNVSVRKAALSTCCNLVKGSEFKQYISSRMKHFVLEIGDRMQDIDMSTAILAVNCFTNMLKTYPNDIPQLYHTTIIELAYYNHYDLAVAAGKFIVEFLDTVTDFSQNTTNIHLENIAQMFLSTQTENAAPVFVEALLPNFTALQEWDEIIEILLSDALSDDKLNALVELFAQSIEQTVTGKSKYARIRAPRVRNTRAQVVKVATNAVLSNLYSLLVKFPRDPNIFIMLAELLLVIDFNYMSMQHADEMAKTVNILCLAFIKLNDAEKLEKLSKVFKKFMGEHCILQNQVKGRINNMINLCYKGFFNQINSLNELEEVSSQDALVFETVFLKIVVLFKHHDLTESLAYENIIDNWNVFEDMLPAKCMKFIILIACWHLIWQLCSIIENGSKVNPAEELTQNVEALKTVCEDYINKLIGILRKNQAAFTKTAFECLVDVMTNFYDIVKPVRSNNILKYVQPTIDEPGQHIFMNYVVKEVFGMRFNVTPLTERKGMIVKVFNVCLLGAISFHHLAKIFKNYVLHQDDYGDVLTECLQRIESYKTNHFENLVILTLSCQYSTILKHSRPSVLENERCIALSKLAEKFHTFLKKSSDKMKDLLKHGINFAFSGKHNYVFLHFIKIYVSSLPNTQKDEMLKYFNSRLPKESRNHEAIVSFKAHLKKKNVEQNLADKDPTSSLSSVSSISTMHLNFDDSEDIESVETDYEINEFF